jgi:hypothetical protein
MPAGVLLLGQIAERISMLEIACNRCDRLRGIAQHGPTIGTYAELEVLDLG